MFIPDNQGFEGPDRDSRVLSAIGGGAVGGGLQHRLHAGDLVGGPCVYMGVGILVPKANGPSRWTEAPGVKS